jgi:hypothetical protein
MMVVIVRKYCINEKSYNEAVVDIKIKPSKKNGDRIKPSK